MKLFNVIVATTLFGCGTKEPSDTEPSDEVFDADGDGVTSDLDCDDEDASRYPEADEVCDGVDNNCDDLIDNEAIDELEYYLDEDGDGFGVDTTTEMACEAPEGFVDVANDCDDERPENNPEAPEQCDGMDNNCDGAVDEELTVITTYIDEDGDGFGNADVVLEDCLILDGYVDNMNDCDDEDELIGSSLEDMDCDGLLDVEDDDVDGDGLLAEEECNDLDSTLVQLLDSVETISIDADGDGDAETVETYAYDENGRILTKISIQDVNGDDVDDQIKTEYTYNADGSLSTGTITYDYSIDSSEEIAYTFVTTQDSAGNVISLIGNGSRVDGSTFTYSYLYTYDVEGNILTEIFEADWTGDGITSESSLKTNTYDNVMGVLISASVDALNADEETLIDGVPEDVRVYTYDEYGNLLTAQLSFDVNSDGVLDESYMVEYTNLSDGRISSYVMNVDWDADGTDDAVYTYTYIYNEDDLLELLEQVVEYVAEIYQQYNYSKTTMYTYNQNNDLLMTEIDNEADGEADTVYSNIYNEDGQLIVEETSDGIFSYTYLACPE